MPRLTDLADQLPQPKPQAQRHGSLPTGKHVREQVPVDSDSYGDRSDLPDALDAAPTNGHGPVQVIVQTVEVPVWETPNPANPNIALVLERVKEQLRMLGESGTAGLGRDHFNGPIPTEAGLAQAITGFKRARLWREADHMLIRLAASTIAFAARRMEDRCREYSSPQQSKPLV